MLRKVAFELVEDKKEKQYDLYFNDEDENFVKDKEE